MLLHEKSKHETSHADILNNLCKDTTQTVNKSSFFLFPENTVIF